MYFVRDAGENFAKVSVTEGAWEYVFGISKAVHSDKTPAFLAEISDVPKRIATADLVASTFAALYRAGKLSNEEVAEMLELCASSLTNHQFRSLPIKEFRRRLFGTEHVVTAILGCQNLTTLKRRAVAAVSLCASSGKAMRLVPSGLRPPHGVIRTDQEFAKLQEYIDDEIRKRRADILHLPEIFPVVPESKSSDTKQNIENILTTKGIIPDDGASCLIIVSSTFHLMQIAKIINGHYAKNSFSIRDRFSFVGLVGAEHPSDALTFTPPHYWQYVKQLAYQLFVDHMA